MVIKKSDVQPAVRPSFCCLVASVKHFILQTPYYFFVAVSDQMLHPDKTGKNYSFVHFNF
jgi:hypothetical protein